MKAAFLLILIAVAHATVNFQITENDIVFASSSEGVQNPTEPQNCSESVTKPLLKIFSDAGCSLLHSRCSPSSLFVSFEAWIQGPCNFDAKSLVLINTNNDDAEVVMGPVKAVNSTLAVASLSSQFVVAPGHQANFSSSDDGCDGLGFSMSVLSRCIVDCTDCKTDGELSVYGASGNGCIIPLGFFSDTNGTFTFGTGKAPTSPGECSIFNNRKKAVIR